MIVGFAAETGDSGADVLEHARAKLKRKGCDLLVVNAVGEGKAFETEDNAGWLLSADGSERPIALGSKAHMASDIWDAVVVTDSEVSVARYLVHSLQTVTRERLGGIRRE